MITLIIVIVIVIVVTIYMLTIEFSETNMKCEVCGTKYSSKYYFLDSSTECNECFKFKKQKNEFEKGQKTQNHLNLMINPSNIISAGRNIKSVVYVILVMTLFAIIAILIATNSTNPGIIKITYQFLVAANLICYPIILILLYSAGDDLEKAFIKKKNE